MNKSVKGGVRASLPVFVGLMTLLSLVVMPGMLTKPAGATPVNNKIDICHATGESTYTSDNVDKDATAGGHDGDSGDIIPSYDYQEWEVTGSHMECPSGYSPAPVMCPGRCRENDHPLNPARCTDKVSVDDYGWVSHSYPGKNWDTEGQAIWNNGCVVPAYCGDGNLDSGEQCDGSDLNGAACTNPDFGNFTGGTLACDPVTCQFDTTGCTTENGGDSYATIIAHKIVCTDETDLPNWGLGGSDIEASTAADWVSQHPNCSFATGWDFQWVLSSQTSDPGDTMTGPAGGSWQPFESNTGGAVGAQVQLTEAELAGETKIWLREVLQSGFIPFTHEASPDNSDNVTAEFYCNDDVLNYDNYEWIDSIQMDETYYCVAFNVPEDDGGGDDGGTISGMKINDRDGNRNQSTGEVGLEGWTIELYLYGNPSSTLVATTTTNVDGFYSFVDLEDGNYEVCEVQQDGWQQTDPIENGCHEITIDGGEGPEGSFDFFNQRDPRIIVRKVASSDPEQEFEFRASWLRSNLFLSDGEEHDSGDLIGMLEGNPFSVEEVNIPSGWELTSAVCESTDENDESTPDNIDLQDGEVITCTFTNDQEGDEPSDGGGGTPQHPYDDNEGEVEGESTGEVLGEQTEIVPAGAPATGLGGASTQAMAGAGLLFTLLGLIGLSFANRKS